MAYAEGDIYYLWVEYDEPNENGETGKHRPVVLLQFNDAFQIAAYAQVTSVPPPKRVTELHQYKSFVEDWDTCGLKEPSYIQLHDKTMKTCDYSDLTRKYGKLTDRDFEIFIGKAKLLKEKLENLKSYYIEIT